MMQNKVLLRTYKTITANRFREAVISWQRPVNNVVSKVITFVLRRLQGNRA